MISKTVNHDCWPCHCPHSLGMHLMPYQHTAISIASSHPRFTITIILPQSSPPALWSHLQPLSDCPPCHHPHCLGMQAMPHQHCHLYCITASQVHHHHHIATLITVITTSFVISSSTSRCSLSGWGWLFLCSMLYIFFQVFCIMASWKGSLSPTCVSLWFSQLISYVVASLYPIDLVGHSHQLVVCIHPSLMPRDPLVPSTCHVPLEVHVEAIKAAPLPTHTIVSMELDDAKEELELENSRSTQ